MQYRLGTYNDLDAICSLIKQAISEMESHGIYQWDKLYPTEEVIVNDISNGELYIGKVEDIIAVIYVINKSYDVEYHNGDWQYPNAEYRIIHRLCVHPEYQQKGIAKMTMQYIEDEIRQSNVEAIRLDVFSENPYALKLYQNMGFIKTGHADWRKGRFYLMEKYIK